MTCGSCDAERVGRRLDIQVLRPGTDVPTVTAVHEFTVGGPVTFTVPRPHVADGDWMLLRIADPTQVNATPGPDGHPGNHLGIAYTSPWWLEVAGGPR